MTRFRMLRFMYGRCVWFVNALYVAAGLAATLGLLVCVSLDPGRHGKLIAVVFGLVLVSFGVMFKTTKLRRADQPRLSAEDDVREQIDRHLSTAPHTPYAATLEVQSDEAQYLVYRQGRMRFVTVVRHDDLRHYQPTLFAKPAEVPVTAYVFGVRGNVYRQPSTIDVSWNGSPDGFELVLDPASIALAKLALVTPEEIFLAMRIADPDIAELERLAEALSAATLPGGAS